MLPSNIDTAFNAIVAAVRNGEIPESRIDESVRRILEAKAVLGLNKSRYVDLDRVKTLFADKAPYDFAQQISDSAVTLVRDNGKVLPIPSSGNELALEGHAPRTSGKVVAMPVFTEIRLHRLPRHKIHAIYPGAAMCRARRPQGSSGGRQ